MNVYDTANKLAKEIKESQEYLDYKSIKDDINDNPDLKEKIQEFEKIRYDIQVLSLSGEQKDQEKLNQMQELYVELIKNDKIKRYFDSELKFNVLLGDINKIIGEAIREVIF